MTYNPSISGSIVDNKPAKQENSYRFSLLRYIIPLCYCLGPEALLIFVRTDVELAVSQEILVIIFVCLPMLYMEVTLGKYTQSGVFHLQYMIPLAKGITYMFVVNTVIGIIECVHYLTDVVLYFLLSFQKNLPWKECPADTEKFCYYNRTKLEDCTKSKTACRHSARLFWQYIYMDNPAKSTKPVLQRFVCVWLCWLILFAIVYFVWQKRYKMYILLFIQFIICFCLLLNGVFFANGSAAGVTEMFGIHPEHFMNMSKWAGAIRKNTKILALGQVAHVLGGERMAVSTSADVWCVVFLIAFVLIASLYSVLVYGILGIGRYHSGLPAKDNKLLSMYYVYMFYAPGYLSYLSAPQCWCIIFFWSAICLLTLNIVTRLLSILYSITIHVKSMLKYRIYLLALSCVIGAIIGSITLPGSYVPSVVLLFHEIFDLTELLAATFLSIVVFWIYSVQTLADDIYFISGRQPTKFWKISWYFSPLIYTITTVYSFYMCAKQAERITFQIGIISAIASPAIIFAIIQFFVYLKKGRIMSLLQPEVEWGVPDPEERHSRRLFNPRKEVRSKIRKYKCHHKCLVGSTVLRHVCKQEANQRRELFEQ